LAQAMTKCMLSQLHEIWKALGVTYFS
jgi:hypothetical protein